MNVSGNEVETAPANVVPLFAKIQIKTDPMKGVDESLMDWDLKVGGDPAPKVTRQLVTENHFPDQSLYILNEQVAKIKESIERLKFYLNDVDDLLPR